MFRWFVSFLSCLTHIRPHHVFGVVGFDGVHAAVDGLGTHTGRHGASARGARCSRGSCWKNGVLVGNNIMFVKKIATSYFVEFTCNFQPNNIVLGSKFQIDIINVDEFLPTETILAELPGGNYHFIALSSDLPCNVLFSTSNPLNFHEI